MRESFSCTTGLTNHIYAEAITKKFIELKEEKKLALWNNWNWMVLPCGQYTSGAQRLHSKLSAASSHVKHLNPPGYGVAVSTHTHTTVTLQST